MEFTIGAGRRDDIETYVELLVEAFADDPLVVEQAGPDAEAGLRAQFRALIDAVYLDTGKVDVAYVDGEIAGVALWLTPKDSQKTDGVGRRLIRNVKRVRTFSRHVPELLRALPPARQIPRLVSATRTMAGAVPRIPHWHLMDIAVSAEHRGHNMGGRLLEHGLDRVDQSQAQLI